MNLPFGMIPALPTPMLDENTIDYEGLGKLIDYLIESDVHGLLVGGSTGEYSLMTMDERKLVMKYVCDKANGRVPVMAGTGCHRTSDTIELTKYAASVGAETALVINPYYMTTSREGIIDHYRKVAKSTDIGIVIYNYPDATGVDLDPELLYEISQIDGVVGIKNTADGQHTSKLIALTKDNPNFSVLTGFEHMILATLAMGGRGSIGVAHNLAPKKLVQLYDAVQQNNLAEATQINLDLLDLYNAIEAEVIPGTVKAGLEVKGLAGGPSRLPLISASYQFKEKITEILTKLGEI